MTNYKNIVITAVVIILLVACLFAATHLFFGPQPNKLTVQPSLTTPVLPPDASTTSSTSRLVVNATSTRINNATGTKTYRNTEYGFEFQYPSDLIVRENTFGSRNSKFNLEVDATNKEGKYLDVFQINVVLPAFADNAFRRIDSGTSTVVANVPGIRYEYEFESLPQVTILLPLGENRIFLEIDGAAKFYGYEPVFNQILASFKFLNKPQ